MASAPSLDHGVRDLRMKLHANGRLAINDGLVLEGPVRRCQNGRTAWPIETLAMPLVDTPWPVTKVAGVRSWPDRMVTDLDALLGVLVNASAELTREHLRPEANAEERLALLE